jgi:hypothetical protein
VNPSHPAPSHHVERPVDTRRSVHWGPEGAKCDTATVLSSLWRPWCTAGAPGQVGRLLRGISIVFHIHACCRCEVCNGRGRYMHLKMCDHGKGYSHGVNVDCHHCEGTGQVIVTPCSHCNGEAAHLVALSSWCGPECIRLGVRNCSVTTGTRYITDTITVPVAVPPGVKHVRLFGFCLDSGICAFGFTGIRCGFVSLWIGCTTSVQG